MAVLRKQKQYDWKDSNLALFGSSTDNEVKKASADTEPAWRNAGRIPGLRIWRIVNFKVTDWPRVDYGMFYSGDSYIILNTYKQDASDELRYDVHFWIGKYSTQDEYGTAAYKTVELDTFLDGKPVQHREVQGHESKLFTGYFKKMSLLEGGAESGFRHVKPEEYQPRLLLFKGDKKHVIIKEVPRRPEYLDSSDVFILDLGKHIYQWNGSASNGHERIKGMHHLSQLKSERAGKAKFETLDEHDTPRSHIFYKSLNAELEERDSTDYAEGNPLDCTKELFRLSDATGVMEFNLEKSGDVTMSDFQSEDVFILDTKSEVFVWIGDRTTDNERKNSIIYAHNYLKTTDHPLLPIVCLREGMKSDQLDAAIAA